MNVLGPCYRLNDILPKLLYWYPILQCECIWRSGFEELNLNRSIRTGASFSTSLLVRKGTGTGDANTQREERTCVDMERQRDPQETWAPWSLVLVSRTVGVKMLLFMPPGLWSFVMVAEQGLIIPTWSQMTLLSSSFLSMEGFNCHVP